MNTKIFTGVASFSLLVLFIVIHNPTLSSGDTKVKALRQFRTTINPNCTFAIDCEHWSNVSLIHIRSDSDEDSLHFIWSFIGRPSVLMARTSLASDLIVNWPEVLSPDSEDDVSIYFSGPKAYYTFGWSLLTAWVFNDAKDKVRMNLANQTEMFQYNTKGFLWERQNGTVTSSEINLNFESTKYKKNKTEYSLGAKACFAIRIRMKNTDEYSDFLPYMLYSGNISQIDVTFKNVQLNFTDEFKYPEKPRVGLTYAFVQGDSDRESNQTMRIEQITMLDDEHSPGVFELYRVRTPLISGTEQSYFEWRPICYIAEKRDISDSIDVVSYDLTPATAEKTIEGLNDTLLWAYYADEVDSFIVQALNISFGTEQDGFYNKTKLIQWTFNTGFGSPPTDKPSLLVMLVIMIGLGIPLLIIGAALIYMFTKRLKHPRDDLLLSN